MWIPFIARLKLWDHSVLWLVLTPEAFLIDGFFPWQTKQTQTKQTQTELNQTKPHYQTQYY